MIVITGASDGLGKEIARLYKAANKKVVNISRSKSDVADINLLHDLSIESEVKSVIAELEEIDDVIEVFINNAGVYSDKKLGVIDKQEIDTLISVNTGSNILLMSGLIDHIKKNGTDVVFVVSTAATKGNPNHPTYAVSKWAQRGFAKVLQEDLKEYKSRVIVAFPGGMKTDMFEKWPNSDSSEDTSTYMEPKDIAVLIKSLLDMPKNIEVSEIIINRKK